MKKRNNTLSSQEQYIRKYKLHRRQMTFCRFLILFLFLALWEISSSFGWIDAFFFSSPSRILRLIWKFSKDGSLFLHIGITLTETILSFVLVFVISLLCATLLWISPKFSEILEPYLVILNSLPKSALAPLFIVWLGTGMNTIVVAGISVAVFGSILSFYNSFRQCDPEKLILIQTLGGDKKAAFFKVILPGSTPDLLSTSKVNIGLALVGVIIGEFLAARRGLGYLIIYGSQVFQLDQVIASIFLLCLIAFGFYQGIQLIEQKVMHNMLRSQSDKTP